MTIPTPSPTITDRYEIPVIPIVNDGPGAQGLLCILAIIVIGVLYIAARGGRPTSN